MFRVFVFFTSLLLTTFLYQNCGEKSNVEISTSNSVFNEDDVVGFEGHSGRNALKVLAQHCNSCHGLNSQGLGGIDYILNEEQLIARGLVVPGKPQSSRLFQVIQTSEETGEAAMPPLYSLSSWVISDIESWIANIPTTQVIEVPGEGGNPEPVTFAQANGVLLTYCLGCHSSGNPNGGGHDLGTYVGVSNYIIPGNSVGSQLIDSMEQGRMPPNGNSVPTQDLDLLKRWVNEGAPNL